MREQFPNLYALTGGSFSESFIRGLELDLEFQPGDLKREIREYRQFQREVDCWHSGAVAA